MANGSLIAGIGMLAITAFSATTVVQPR